jgi:hypothetical protein
VAVDWELGDYNRLLEGGLVRGRRVIGKGGEVEGIVKLVQGWTLQMLWFAS